MIDGRWLSLLGVGILCLGIVLGTTGCVMLQLLAEGVEWPDGIARPCVGGDDSQSEGKIGRKV